MYGYTHDARTGGLLLNDSTPMFSKEPRPVYYRELDILGFDAHFNYEKQDDQPYMWAETNSYWYRGQLIAKTKGGSLYSTPELELTHNADGAQVLPDGETLFPVDIAAMVEKNRELLEVIEQTTVKRIFDTYKRHHKKLDCFYVAFSGGKDSIVLLDLVKKALPKSGFAVVFGDTGMEFPDTYDVIDKVERQCRTEEIVFHRAVSHLTPEESWRIFGPPSRVLRWCCSVHKSAPQTLALRKVLNKNDYVGLAFVGVRAHESASRADYDYENYGKKQKGQYAHNSILEWNSAEVWLHIFSNKLVINEAYKKGNSRVGCLFCPMGGGKSDCFRNLSYSKEIRSYTDIIKETVDENSITDYESYISNGGWAARGSGRDLKSRQSPYKEEIKGKTLQITISDPAQDWREWAKTLGDLPFEYSIKATDNGCVATMPVHRNKTAYAKLLKQVMHKAAHCVGCGACEANCRHGCISFDDGLHIDDCLHCGQCHIIPYGCYVADCLKKPVEGKRMKSLNTFEEHAPKPEWVSDFFERQNDFLKDNGLGPNQHTKFKRFLRDASLIDKNRITDFSELITRIGWDSGSAWGLILVQLVNQNPQIRWYAENLSANVSYSRSEVQDMLMSLALTEKMARAIIYAFGRLCDLPLGLKLNFGTVSFKGKNIDTLTRGKATLEDNRVVLYALYRFAEKCDGYNQFTLTRLLDHSVESAGISPTQIFGFDRDDMVRLLNGLSAKYPEFINATFTHDLDKITLREDKTSADVLNLF
jgi:phosphoadenosine phosphosulfate reductase